MINISKKIIGVLITIVLALIMFPCLVNANETKYVERIYIEYPNKYLEKSKSMYLTANVYPSNASNKNVTWSSSDVSIATINSETGGMTTKSKSGSVTITATAKDGSGAKGSITFIVGYPSVSVGNEIFVGNSSYVSYDTVEWTIENESILKKTGNTRHTSINNNYIHYLGVKGISNGSTTATMKTISGDVLSQSKVYVYTPLENISSDDKSIELEPGNTKQLNISFSPNSVSENFKELHYTSDNTDVATVSDTGLVTATDIGKTNIRVYSQFYGLNLTIPLEAAIYSKSIKVDDPIISLNDDNKQYQLRYEVKPSNVTNKEVTFESSDESIVTVNDEGLIEAVGKGNAIITIKAKDGKSFTEIVVYSNITIPIDEIKLNKTEVKLNKQQSEKLVASIMPENTTEDKTILWSSGNESIATVDENGKITGVEFGRTTITAITSNGKKVQCEVIVADFKEITVNLNGGSGNLSYPVIEKGTQFEITKPSGITAPDGKEFVGWEIDGIKYLIGQKYIVQNDFTIKAIWKWDISNGGIVSGIEDKTFNNEYQRQGNVVLSFNGKVLEPHTDYVGQLKDNRDVGIATITIIGRGDYTGTITRTFRISKGDISEAVINMSDEVYTGKEVKPYISLKYGYSILDKSNYSVSYTNNINVGTATVTITGKGNCFGTITKTFEVLPALIAHNRGYKIMGMVDKVYIGSAITQNIKVMHGEEELDSSNYDIIYDNNINVGTATVTVTGKGNYAGTISETFNIVSKKISASNTKVTGIVNKVFNNKNQTQNIRVTYNGKNVPVRVTYKNNKNIGTATVTITAYGNYSGTITKSFRINPGKATIKSVKPYKKSLTVKRRTTAGGVKYQIAYKQKGTNKWKYVNTTKTTTKIKKLKSKKKYYVKIRAYKVVNKVAYYGNWSGTKTVKVK